MSAAVKTKVYPHPVPYNLEDNTEVYRLLRECRGYLQTCQGKHGTDFKGRQFAMDALDILGKGDWKIVVHPPEIETT